MNLCWFWNRVNRSDSSEPLPSVGSSRFLRSSCVCWLSEGFVLFFLSILLGIICGSEGCFRLRLCGKTLCSPSEDISRWQKIDSDVGKCGFKGPAAFKPRSFLLPYSLPDWFIVNLYVGKKNVPTDFKFLFTCLWLVVVGLMCAGGGVLDIRKMPWCLSVVFDLGD